jgi:hypothetical protein
MRSVSIRYRVTVTFVALLVAMPAIPAERSRMRAWNVGLQPVFTLLSAAVQGKLRSRTDFARCLGVGAIAGYGFSRSKKLAADGHARSGLVLANASASLSRNVAAGRSALSRLGVTAGPLRLDISTPFDANAAAHIHVQASISEAAALFLMWRRSDRLVWRDGLIAFRKNRRYEGDGRHFPGYAIGAFAGTTNHAPAIVWNHEVVHVIQSLQADSVEPPACAWLSRRCGSTSGASSKLIKWEPIQLGVIPVTGGLVLSTTPENPRDARSVSSASIDCASGAIVRHAPSTSSAISHFMT